MKSGDNTSRMAFVTCNKGPVHLAAQRLANVAKSELNCRIEVYPLAKASLCQVIAICQPWEKAARYLLQDAGITLLPSGEIEALSEGLYGEQGFIATRLNGESGGCLFLAANTQSGLKNALLTLCDRLYRDGMDNIVVDCFDGVHRPVFACRHIKTDAMNCGPFRSSFEYWDLSATSGINDFADWLASFRITDYDLLAFVRGWGLTYASERFPSLIDTQHPNPEMNFYPRLMDRLHDWGLKVWAADIYIASGYSMEVGTCTEMLSSCADASHLRPFKAGSGSFTGILGDPEAIVCLSSPIAIKFYADIVMDILEHYPALDGLDFHIGHTFPGKICRCPQCRGLAGNREGVYRCFIRVYETAVKHQPDIQLKAAVKMFGDATRKIVENYKEFPQLEFFCWLRWLGNFLVERTDAPVTTGHEDGGGGLEANHDPKKTLSMIRDYFRDYEPWIWTYVQKTHEAGLPSISWEPVLQKEIEHQFFLYSQLTWEPNLSWREFARRYVILSKRRLDPDLEEAYSLALEANAAATRWGLQPQELGQAQRVTQTKELLESSAVREKVAALQQIIGSMGIAECKPVKQPVFFDLYWSLAKTLSRLRAGEVLGQWH
jgi:hypothetical protein